MRLCCPLCTKGRCLVGHHAPCLRSAPSGTGALSRCRDAYCDITDACRARLSPTVCDTWNSAYSASSWQMHLNWSETDPFDPVRNITNTHEPFSAHRIPLPCQTRERALVLFYRCTVGTSVLAEVQGMTNYRRKQPPKKAKPASFHINKAERDLTIFYPDIHILISSFRAPVRQRARRFCWCLSTLQIHRSTGGDCAWVLKPSADRIWQHVSDFFNDSSIHCNPVWMYMCVYICIYTHIYIYNTCKELQLIRGPWKLILGSLNMYLVDDYEANKSWFIIHLRYLEVYWLRRKNNWFL